MTETIDAANAPPVMSDAYHRARRQLALFSAILIFWEFVGLSVGAPATGNGPVPPSEMELPVTGTKLTIQSPQAIPLVIAAIVCYFGLHNLPM